MDCQCTFRLSSSIVNALTLSYSNETYQMKCNQAVRFLHNLSQESTGKADTHSMHRVTAYVLQQGEKIYKSETAETPVKTAAKIEAFMENPDSLPKTRS